MSYEYDLMLKSLVEEASLLLWQPVRSSSNMKWTPVRGTPTACEITLWSLNYLCTKDLNRDSASSKRGSKINRAPREIRLEGRYIRTQPRSGRVRKGC